MTTLKKFLGRIFPSEKRASVRYPVAQLTQCRVGSQKLSGNVPVYLVDISASGLCFFFKHPWFEVNDSLEIKLEKNARSIELQGQILSQRILYPQGVEDLKLAVYRYSILFSTSLDTEWLESFKEGS